MCQMEDIQLTASSTAIPSSPETVLPPESIIIDLEDESEHPECHGTVPFRFLDLSSDLRKKILREVLVPDWWITPYYNTGSLEAIEAAVQNPNHDTSILSTSKQVQQEAAEVLYGHNIFYFEEPRLALWFFQHIGAANLLKIRLVSFSLSSVPFDSIEKKPFDVVDERLWQEVFAWLKPRHQIEHVELNFSLWHSLELPQSHGKSHSGKMIPRWDHINGWSTSKPVKDPHWFQRRQMQMARTRVLEILMTYRGFMRATIISEGRSSKCGAWLTSQNARALIRQMERDREETVSVGANTTRVIDFGYSS